MKKIFTQLGIILFSLLFLVSCDDNDSSSPTGSSSNGEPVVINASNWDNWTYFSLSDSSVVEIADPDNSLDWDIAFKRYKVKTNSGTSGPGNSGVINLEKVNYDNIEKVPANYYTQDDSILAVGMVTEVFSGNKLLNTWSWHNPIDPSVMPPKITSKKYTYIIRTADGDNYFKTKIESYYNPTTNESGFISLRLDAVSDASNQNITYIKNAIIEPDSTKEWIYYSFAEESIVEVKDPDNSLEWDIAFNRYKIKTNSGTSGSKGFGVNLLGDNVIFDDIRLISNNLPYTSDSELVDPFNNSFNGNSILSSWVDFSTHPHVTHYDRVYCLKIADYEYIKLQLTSYNNGVIKFKYEKYITVEYK